VRDDSLDVAAKPSVSSGSPTDHDHHRRIRLKRPSPIVAERFLDFEAGVAKEQVQFTGKEKRGTLSRRYNFPRCVRVDTSRK
jgi:hypothetical protein